MATSFVFNNQVVKLPGSYSQFKSGVTNPPLSLPFGNVLLVDTGSGVGFGAGAGIAGTLSSNKDAIYEATTLKEFRDAIGGGILWDIAEKLFQPNGAGGGNGISKLFYARAAATVPSQGTLSFAGGGSNGGTAIVKAKNEGTVGNGVEGDQTLATATYTVTATGANGDTHTLKVNEGSLVTIATAAKTASETTTDLMAAKIAAAITGGYTASVNGSIITVTARNPKGLEVASDWNTMAASYVVTGSATGTASATFAGGVDGTVLTRGYAFTMSAGVNDNTKFITKIWKGTFKGIDENSYPWDGTAETSTAPELIIQSPEYDNIADLHTWMNTDQKFGSLFKLTTSTVSGTGAVTSADLSNNAGYNKFSEGTTTYNTSHLDTVLENVADLNYSLILADQYEDDAQSSDNSKLLAHVVDGMTFGDKLIVIGGGRDSNSFAEGVSNSSIETAKYFDTDRVIVCHGGPKKNTNLSADGFIERTSLHKAAAVVGRLGGLQPQIPITFKQLLFDGELHVVNNKEKAQALDKGVLVTYPVGARSEVLQGINSLQRNTYLLNEDSTTHSIQMRRMISQLNTEIVVNATSTLLKNPNGTNRNTLTAADVKSFVETYLKSKTVTTTQDNMIIQFRNVNVVLDGDAWKATYDVVLNTEITKLFFTGTIFLSF